MRRRPPNPLFILTDRSGHEEATGITADLDGRRRFLQSRCDVALPRLAVRLSTIRIDASIEMPE